MHSLSVSIVDQSVEPLCGFDSESEYAAPFTSDARAAAPADGGGSHGSRRRIGVAQTRFRPTGECRAAQGRSFVRLSADIAVEVGDICGHVGKGVLDADVTSDSVAVNALRPSDAEDGREGRKSRQDVRVFSLDIPRGHFTLPIARAVTQRSYQHSRHSGDRHASNDRPSRSTSSVDVRLRRLRARQHRQYDWGCWRRQGDVRPSL
jgi:hypothetical protein